MPNSNKILGDIVIASGGTVTDPSNRNKLLQDWLDALTIERYFISLDSAVMQSYTISNLLTFASGDTFEIDFVAPTGITAANESLCDGDDGADRGFVTLADDGTYNLTSQGAVTVDGISITGASNYPTDGKLHTLKISFTASGKIKFLGRHYLGSNYSNSIISNPNAVIGGVTTSWALDEPTLNTEESQEGGSFITYSNISTGLPDRELFTFVDGDWIGENKITQAIWENPTTIGSEWSFSNDQWSLTGLGTLNRLKLISLAFQPDLMMLSGNVVSISGGLKVSQGVGVQVLTSTGQYDIKISTDTNGQQLFERLSGVVNATLSKPTMKRMIEVAT